MSRLFESVANAKKKKDFLTLLHGILKDCQPFIKEMMKDGEQNFLYSGRGIKMDLWFEGKIRSDRVPKDTNPELHSDLNDFFQKKFGYPVRSSSMFTTVNKHMAQNYGNGNAYIIFPKGNYKYVWSPEIRDLYVHINNRIRNILKTLTKDEQETYWRYAEEGHIPAKFKSIDNPLLKFYIIHTIYRNRKDSPSEIIQKAKSLYFDHLEDIVNTYTNKNLFDSDGQEVLVNGSGYYAVSENRIYNGFLSNYFKKFKTSKPSDKEIEQWYDQNLGHIPW